MFQYILDEPMTVEELLRNKWQLGKKLVHELRMAKAVKDEHSEAVRWNNTFDKGTVLHFHMEIPRSNYKPTRECTLDIVYEDEHCLIVSKPKGMATHPNDEKDEETCMNHVMAHILANCGVYCEHVHRLDKGTSGLLLVAKHPIAKSVMDRMIEDKRIVRIYEAEVQGNVKNESGVIKAPIGKDRHHGSRRVVSKSGQMAVTHYKVVKRLAHSTVVELQLETGRTHQIRVHMAHLGHPIVGDVLYGGKKTRDGQYHLHAKKLKFQHPFLNQKIEVPGT